MTCIFSADYLHRKGFSFADENILGSNKHCLLKPVGSKEDRSPHTLPKRADLRYMDHMTPFNSCPGPSWKEKRIHRRDMAWLGLERVNDHRKFSPCQEFEMKNFKWKKQSAWEGKTKVMRYGDALRAAWRAWESYTAGLGDKRASPTPTPSLVV